MTSMRKSVHISLCQPLCIQTIKDCNNKHMCNILFPNHQICEDYNSADTIYLYVHRNAFCQLLYSLRRVELMLESI